MADRTLQLVLQYDGARFCGWQRQPKSRSVQGDLEQSFERIMSQPISVTGAGRTDAGVHARGQSAHVRVTERWTPELVRRALNAVLPPDIWIRAVYEMKDEFHARYSALARSYSFNVGTNDDARSPFRRHYEWFVPHQLNESLLHESAQLILGDHCFRGFAVRGTAPETDHHRCIVTRAEWKQRDGGWTFQVEANRFLHHMVRFLVGSMVAVASGRRTLNSFQTLLLADDNLSVSPPAPPHALFLDQVVYPEALYLERT